MKVLIIKTNSEPLHYFEFVKPIEEILSGNRIAFFTKHYSELTNKEISAASRIIITGTSLMDNEFLNNLDKFHWIRECNKPILGICAGMQIISLLFGAKRKKETEIGFFKEKFMSDFLSLTGEQEVYHLHNNYTKLPKDFISFTKPHLPRIPQAIKHKTQKIYGVLFHPEVRNKNLIISFCKVK